MYHHNGDHRNSDCFAPLSFLEEPETPGVSGLMIFAAHARHTQTCGAALCVLGGSLLDGSLLLCGYCRKK